MFTVFNYIFLSERRVRNKFYPHCFWPDAVPFWTTTSSGSSKEYFIKIYLVFWIMSVLILASGREEKRPVEISKRRYVHNIKIRLKLNRCRQDSSDSE